MLNTHNQHLAIRGPSAFESEVTKSKLVGAIGWEEAIIMLYNHKTALVQAANLMAEPAGITISSIDHI